MADGDNPGTERISVSRETLRAELAELELRLTRYLDKELHEKANKVEVVALKTAVQDKANIIEFARLREEAVMLETRLARIETDYVKHQGPFADRLKKLSEDFVSYQALSKYKRWLWVQSVALTAVGLTALGLYARSKGY